jgi:hypothetical protein
MFGLSFTNPALLHGLWLGLLPLLIHLLNRRRTVSVAFSNVALLQSLQHDRMKRVKLKQILLLILRSLILLLIVFAFSGPTTKGTVAEGIGSARTAAVILVDRSLSMRHGLSGATLFDRAKTRAREILNLFDSRDEVSLHLFDERSEIYDSRSVEYLQSRLEVARPTYRATDLGPALVQAMEQLKESDLANRELYIISDMARHGWQSVPDSLPSWPGLSVFAVPLPTKGINNQGLIAASPVGHLLAAGRKATLEVELQNYGEETRFELPLEVYVDGRRIAQELLHLNPESRTKRHIEFTPERGGQVTVQVEIGEDDFGTDNVLSSVLTIPELIRVLLIGERTEDTYFVEQALSAALDHGEQIQVHRALVSELTPYHFAESDVIVMSNVSRLSRGMIDRLKNRIAKGAGLLITLGRNVDVRHYNGELLPSLLPSKLVSVVGKPSQVQTYHSFEQPLPSHTLFQNVKPSGGFRIPPRFYAFYKVQPNESTEAIVAYNSGPPAVIEGNIESGITLLLSTSLEQDLSWTDLPVSGLFIPFLHQAVRYLAVGSFGQSNYEVGQPVYREIRGIQAREAHLQPPTGEARTIWPEQRGARPVWPVGEVDEPGLWEIYANERLADRFASHVDRVEADLAPVREIEGYFGSASIQVVAEGEDIIQTVLSSRLGTELWRPVLVMVLLLMGAEMLAARSTRTTSGAM